MLCPPIRVFLCLPTLSIAEHQYRQSLVAVEQRKVQTHFFQLKQNTTLQKLRRGLA
jgi:hypothetical protein